MATITGTEAGERIQTTDEDDILEALGGDDYIDGSQGTDVIDGGAGWDLLSFCLQCTTPGFPAYTGPVQYTLTASRFSDSLGVIDTSFSAIERFGFTAQNSGMVTFDASQWAPDPDVYGTLSVQLHGDNSRVTGSDFNDFIDVFGSNHVVDGGDGFDRVGTRTNGSEYAIVISTTDGVTRITQDGRFATDQTSITATNVELVDILTNGNPYVEQTIDASASALRIFFRDGAGNDTVVGSSSADTFYSYYPFPPNDGIDTYTGGDGADTFSFVNSVARMDNTSITDFSAEDLIDLSNNNTAGDLVTSFIGSDAFSGTAGEYRYETGSGRTLVQYDGDGDGISDGTLTITNGEFNLVAVTTSLVTHALQMSSEIVYANTIRGTSGSETIDGTAANEEIYTFGGNDTVHGFGGHDLIFGMGGDDTLYGDGGNDTLLGGIGNDWLYGGGGSDELHGGDGDDLYAVDDGFDTIIEGRGKGIDSVLSDLENFTLPDNVENLVLYAGAKIGIGNQLDNSLTGSVAANELVGRGGHDMLYGIDGGDVLRGQGGNDVLWGGLGHDDLFGGSGTDTLQGEGGNDQLYGNAGNDFVIGGTGNDGVFGGGGNDNLQGSNGADVLNGHAGDDLIVGGSGIDLLAGGPGADRFLFNEGHLGGGLSVTDRIRDFSQVQGDMIDLHDLDADSIAAGNQAFAWIGNAAFGGTAGELRYNWSGNTTVITGDTDGDGTADFALWLTGQVAVTAGDLVL
jgi:Ca2+-binding RTX toxin-like protein